jgi:GPI ethanolamine phosphate transferase 1
VDKIVQQIDKIFREFYSNDNLTSFIFTSDHGMTDWGSHGSGDDTERITPFISWGTGIAHNLELSLEQADITPLMSYLIGIPIPVNSVVS